MATATMHQEMARQATTLTASLPELRTRAAALPAPAAGGTVWAGGCGDSWFAAQASLDAFAAAGVAYRPASALELGHLTSAAPRPGDVAILISMSGGTLRTVEAAERLARTGVATVALTCSGESALDEACDRSFVLPYTPLSRAVPHTTDYTLTLLALAVAAEALGGTRLAALDGIGPSWDAQARAASEATADWADHYAARGGKLIVLGGLGDLGTAGYGAAKFHEAGGLAALAMETENFCHGANFMTAGEDLLIALAGPTPAGARGVEVAGGMAQLCRSGVILGGPGEGGDAALVQAHSDADPVTFPFLAALTLQTLCWQVACQLTPDLEAPRGGFADGQQHGAVQTRLLKQGKRHLR